MGRLFGTDGVRGIANQELTAELAYKLGQAGAYVLTKETHHEAKILVGMDTRRSGDMLESALIAGICSVGAHAISIGVVPTPAVAHLVREYGVDAGVVISASHNPVEYNGIKFFDSEGYKLRDELEEEIEAIILDHAEVLPQPIGDKVGTKIVKEDALDDYMTYLTATMDVDLTGIRVAIDCANGAAYKAAPLVLMELGADVHVIHNEPDGTNINKNCGSTHMEDLANYVKEVGAQIGLAFDGDADRCLALDENDKLIDGDQIMAICGIHMKAQGKLPHNTIVATVMSNLGFFIMGKQQGIHIEQTKVGDRYVLEEMIKDDFKLGGEQSGHIIFLDHNTTGDGVLTGLKLLSVLKKTGKKASELAAVMEILPQVLVNAKVSNDKKYTYMEDIEIKQAIDQLEAKFAGDGRVLIRPSGTEPLVRVMIEGKDQEELTKAAEKLAKLIQERLQ